MQVPTDTNGGLNWYQTRILCPQSQWIFLQSISTHARHLLGAPQTWEFSQKSSMLDFGTTVLCLLQGISTTSVERHQQANTSTLAKGTATNCAYYHGRRPGSSDHGSGSSSRNNLPNTLSSLFSTTAQLTLSNISDVSFCLATNSGRLPYGIAV